MKRLLIGTVSAGALVATSALAETPQRMPKMSAKRVAHEAEASTSALTSVALLAMLAVLVVVAISSGGGHSTYTMSDERLKKDIEPTGRSVDGIPIYRFRYKGYDHLFEGVMAQDVLRLRPDAVMTVDGGYKAVNYDALGLQLRVIQ